MTELEWLGENNKLGIDIWNKKYRFEEESFEEWLDRVSANNNDVKQLIKEKKFLFGGRILANRGLEKLGKKITLSNCYVVAPPEDQLESIYEAASKLARTYSYGGGCGIDISKLSPRGAKINNAAKETSGAVSFMDTYSQVTEQIGQNGRRGALMISIDCSHPDLEEFIDIKKDLNKVTKANISVKITDEFMDAVINNKDYKLSFIREETGEEISKVVNAREVFMKLAQNNWEMAEPGCLFWDRIRNYNLLSNTKTFEYAGVNPCAEEPLPAGGSCLLGSMNLSAFIHENKFDFDEFSEAVRTAVVALNEVLDDGLPLHPLAEQRESVANWRQIGLGIFGLADMLIKMKITYGSQESVDLCDKIGYVMASSAMEQSGALAEQAGQYPNCNIKDVIHTNFFKTNAPTDLSNIVNHGLRNSQLLTIAPTGSLSSMLGVSGGIEPIFANSYTRKTESLNGEDTYYKIYTPIVDEYMKANGITEEENLPEWFITAGQLDYRKRIDMQSVWQKHIDASISSTVNVPNEFTVDDVFNLYVYAWEKGLKGVTIYRDGCSRTGILTTDKPKEEEKTKINILKRGSIMKCTDNVVGKKRTLQTGCGTLHVIAFFDPDTGELVETYFNKGSTGGCVAGETEYFNGKTWKPIKDYTDGEPVLQYNEDGSVKLVQPIDYIVNDNINTLKKFSNKYLSMILSDDHRMYLYKNYGHYKAGRDKNLTTEIITVQDYLADPKERHLPTTFTYESEGIPLSDEQIKMCVAFYADGTIYNNTSNYCNIMISKDRKKERLVSILEANNIQYKIFDYDSTKEKNYLSYKFYIDKDTIFGQYLLDKQFTYKWYDCTEHQRKLILEELQYWDGHKEPGNRGFCFTSKKDEEIDFIQFIASSCGYRATVSNIKGAKRVRFNDNLTILGIKHMEVSEVATSDNKSYCFCVPSGLLVLRYNGNIFITGNCNNFMIGLSRMVSLACRAGVSVFDIKDQLDSTGSCPSYATRTATKHDTSKGSCCPMAIGNALISMYNEVISEIEEHIERTENTYHVEKDEDGYPTCPECGDPLIQEGGCVICKSCGWTKCD